MGSAIADYVDTHILTQESITIMIAAWLLTEVVAWLLHKGSDWLPRTWGIRLWEWGNKFKIASGPAWGMLLVWIPTARPPLCDVGMRMPDDASCETYFFRVTVGALLGAIVLGAHMGGIRYLKRFIRARLGLEKRTPEVTKTK